MKELIKQILRENIQQADKYYFKNNKLSPKVREIILKITNGDPYTKLITDIYYDTLYRNHDMGNWALSHIDDKHEANEHPESDILKIEDIRKIQEIYKELKNYNKNVFPIKGFNINGVENIPQFTQALKERKSIIEKLLTLPTVATRNLKNDIRQERDSSELQDYRSRLEYFLLHLAYLGNREPELRKNIENKMYRSDSSLEDWLDFAEAKENLLGGGEYTKKQVKEIVNNSYDLEIVYSKGDKMIVEVTGYEGIREIGCNSLWCFTYAGKHGNSGDWYTYSTNDTVYVLIDFSEPSDSSEFMHVLIKPIPNLTGDEREDEESQQSTLYNMANEEQYDINRIIEHFLPLEKAQRLMNFGIEPEKKPRAKKKKFVDPNQLSFQFEGKKLIQKLLREELNPSTNCDCCQYFDMTALDNFTGLRHPIYSMIEKRQIEELVYISPKQYIYNIARGFGLSYEDVLGSAYNDEKAKKYAEDMKNGAKFPLPYYKEGMGDQEGRHRAMAAMMLGCNVIPVVKKTSINGDYAHKFIEQNKHLDRPALDAMFKEKGYHGISDLDYRDFKRYIEYRL